MVIWLTQQIMFYCMSHVWIPQILYIELNLEDISSIQPFTYNIIKSIIKVIPYIAHCTVPRECSKRFILHFPGRHIQSDTISISLEIYCNYNDQRNTLLCLSVLRTLYLLAYDFEVSWYRKHQTHAK